MKMLRTLAPGVTVVGLMCVTSARASLSDVGSPIPGNSWAQEFVESGVTFNNIEVSWVSGTQFEPTALRDFSDGSWLAAPGSSTSDSASGNALATLYFTVNYVDPQANPTTFDFYATEGTAVVDSAQASWNGSEWDISTIPVPEPTTVIAGALLLLPFKAGALRMLRQNRTA